MLDVPQAKLAINYIIRYPSTFEYGDFQRSYNAQMDAHFAEQLAIVIQAFPKESDWYYKLSPLLMVELKLKTYPRYLFTCCLLASIFLMFNTASDLLGLCQISYRLQHGGAYDC